MAAKHGLMGIPLTAHHRQQEMTSMATIREAIDIDIKKFNETITQTRDLIECQQITVYKQTIEYICLNETNKK